MKRFSLELYSVTNSSNEKINIVILESKNEKYILYLAQDNEWSNDFIPFEMTEAYQINQKRKFPLLEFKTLSKKINQKEIHSLTCNNQKVFLYKTTSKVIFDDPHMRLLLSNGNKYTYQQKFERPFDISEIVSEEEVQEELEEQVEKELEEQVEKELEEQKIDEVQEEQVEEASKTMDEVFKQVDEAPKQVEEVSKQVDEAPKQEEEVFKPVEEVSKPVEEVAKPVQKEEEKVLESIPVVKTYQDKVKSLMEEIEKEKISMQQPEKILDKNNSQPTFENILVDFVHFLKDEKKTSGEEYKYKNIHQKIERKMEKSESNEVDSSHKPLTESSANEKYKFTFSKIVYQNKPYNIPTLRLIPSPTLNASNLLTTPIPTQNQLPDAPVGIEMVDENQTYLVMVKNQKILVRKNGRQISFINLNNKQTVSTNGYDKVKWNTFDYVLFNSHTLMVPLVLNRVYDNQSGATLNYYLPRGL